MRLSELEGDWKIICGNSSQLSINLGTGNGKLCYIMCKESLVACPVVVHPTLKGHYLLPSYKAFPLFPDAVIAI